MATKLPRVSLQGDGREREELGAISVWRASFARPTARYYPLRDWGWTLAQRKLPAAACAGPSCMATTGSEISSSASGPAILDWELAHLGDPHEDLAWALMPTFNARSRKLYGVVERNRVVALCQRASGISISAKSLTDVHVCQREAPRPNPIPKFSEPSRYRGLAAGPSPRAALRPGPR
jgi:hypothetical protein